MSRENSGFWTVAKAVVTASAFLMATAPGYATENARERRDARDTKQETRQDARSTKADCRQADEKSNSECRQDKREAKQTGRQESRDVRSGETPSKY